MWLVTGWRITFVESALYGEARKSEPRKCRKWSVCVFVEGDQHHNKNPPQFRPIDSKNNTIALQFLPQSLKAGTVYKCRLKVGVKNMSKIDDYIGFEGKRCVNGFVSWQMLLAYFSALASMKC